MFVVLNAPFPLPQPPPPPPPLLPQTTQNDQFTYGYNPQYFLDVRVPVPDASVPRSRWRDKKFVKPVWVLLSRHITHKPVDDSKRPRLADGRVDARSNDNDYLTLHLFDARAQAEPSADASVP